VAGTEHGTLYISPCDDTIGGRDDPLTLMERYLMVQAEGKGKPPRKVELAWGMHAMVLWNLVVQADIPNGTQGTVEDILLDPGEPSVPVGTCIHHLQYPLAE
jgi:hypothetical protein